MSGSFNIDARGADLGAVDRLAQKIAQSKMTRRERLQAFVDLLENKPAVWGEDDCTMICGRWLEQETGLTVPDMDYSSEDEARSMIEAEGGLDNMFRNRMSQIGIQETYTPQFGDIGVIDTRKFGYVGVIFMDNEATIWRSDSSYRMFRPRGFVCAFRVPEPR